MNTQWAIALMDELAGQGLQHVVISPGSRGTPLVLAADAHPDITTTVHIDERGAGFFAVGIARATQRPAAVITTSGTAVANLVPACAEAHQDNVPVVLLTADRPPTLRHSGANQTMDQVGLFARFVRFEADLPVPGPDHAALRKTARDAMRHAIAWPPGPVHLNQPFDKPLEPDEAGQAAIRALAAQEPRFPALPAMSAPSGPVPAIERLGPNGLIVCGPGTGKHLAQRILALGRKLQVPVVADALSGLRFGPPSQRPTMVAAHDLFLGAKATHGLRPDHVIQFGRSPTSTALQQYLGAQACPRYRFDHSGRRWDDIGADVRFVACDPAQWIEALIESDAVQLADSNRSDSSVREPAKAPAVPTKSGALGGPGASTRSDPSATPGSDSDAGSATRHAGQWLETWQALDKHARHAAASALADAPDMEAAWVPAVTRHAVRLFVGNSMPVRDLDRFASASHAIEVAANRGVSGIDGTIATAAGWAVGGPGVAVIGDVAFQHDVGSLPLLPEHLRLVVLRNGGGRIFHHLPISGATDRFDRLFLTPPQVDIEKACAAFGLDAVATPPSGLAEALRGTARVIIVDVDGEASANWRQEMAQRVHNDVAGLIDGT